MFTSRQREIIDASIKLIARGGIQEVTMKHLSIEVGISEPALYRHFKSKHDIMAGVIESFRYHNKMVPENVNDFDVDSLEKLKLAVDTVLRKFSDNPEISGVFFSEEIFHNDAQLTAQMSELLEEYRGFFLGLIDSGIRDGSLRVDIKKEDISLIIIGVVRLLVVRWRLSGYSFNLVEAGNGIFERTIKVIFQK